MLLIHSCSAFHRTGQNSRAPSVSAHFMKASSPDSLLGKESRLKNMSRELRTSLNLTTALFSSRIPVYCLASSFTCDEKKSVKCNVQKAIECMVHLQPAFLILNVSFWNCANYFDNFLNKMICDTWSAC